MSFNLVYNDYKLSKVLSVDTIVSADYVQGKMIPHFSHTHKSAWEMVLCLKGTANVMQEERWQTLEKEEAIFIRPGTVHDVGIPKEDCRAFVVSFTCSGVYNLMPLENRRITVNESQLAIINRLMNELQGAFEPNTAGLRLRTFHPSESSPLGAEQVITCWLEIFIIMCLRDITMRNGVVAIHSEYRNVVSDYMIEQVTHYIGSHLNEHLTVSDIAAHFHYSRSRLSTLYKEATGKGINEMITEMRITLARYRLRECGESVTDTAEYCGFSTPQYFSRVFTEKCGVTPSEYQRNCLQEREGLHEELRPDTAYQ